MIRRTITATCLLAAALLTGACTEDPLARDIGFAPRSLDGTEVDGLFHYDRDGNFVFDDDAQRAFDYFLTSEGELTAEEMYLWVDTQIVAHVPPEQRENVTTSWYAYVSYRAEAAAALEAEHGQQAAPGQAQQAIGELLDTLATDAALAGSPFAASERARLERALSIHEVELAFSRDELDRSQRDAALTELDRDAAERFAQTRAGRFLAAREAVESARAAGADAEQLHALRVEHFDALEPGAAERLEALELRRAQWSARVREYEQARAELTRGWTGSERELQAELDALTDASFSAREQLRLPN